jgi:hypothetical protein
MNNEVVVFLIEVALFLERLLDRAIDRVVPAIISYSAEISTALNLGVGFFSITLLVRAEKLWRATDVVFRRYEAEKILETITSESQKFGFHLMDTSMIKPMLGVCFIVLMLIIINDPLPPPRGGGGDDNLVFLCST